MDETPYQLGRMIAYHMLQSARSTASNCEDSFPRQSRLPLQLRSMSKAFNRKPSVFRRLSVRFSNYRRQRSGSTGRVQGCSRWLKLTFRILCPSSIAPTVRVNRYSRDTKAIPAPHLHRIQSQRCLPLLRSSEPSLALYWGSFRTMKEKMMLHIKR
jgi:hypothetical protein